MEAELQSLPKDILELIATHLPTWYLRIFSVVCKRFQSLLIVQRAPNTPKVYYLNAINSGSLSLLKWLFSRGIRISISQSNEICVEAARLGNAKILEWVCDHGATWSPRAA